MNTEESGGCGIGIVIADDHPIFLKGLRDILEEEPDFHIVSEHHDGETALSSIRAHHPAVAILDIEMPGLSGLDVAAVVQRDHIPTRIVILSMADRDEIIRRAIDFGAVGYILKEAAASELVMGIRTILRGAYFFSPAIAVRTLLAFTDHEGAQHPASVLAELTPTERKVLLLIAENKSSTEIGDVLSISPRTVEKHRANISAKLDLHGSYALVRYALQNKSIL